LNKNLIITNKTCRPIEVHTDKGWFPCDLALYVLYIWNMFGDDVAVAHSVKNYLCLSAG